MGRRRAALVVLALAAAAVAGPGAVRPGAARATAEPPPPAMTSEPVAPTSAEQAEVEAAAAQARTTGQRVELASRRTETQTTYVEPTSGHTTLETALRPVRVRRGESWVPVDLSLEPVPGGFRPRASTTDVLVSGGGDGPVATLTEGDRAVSVGWPAPLPAPTVDGPVATYALDADRQLRVTVTATGFQQHLVLLRRPTAPPVLRIPLTVTGLTIADQVDGGLSLTDPAGTARMQMAPPTMWGAARDADTEEPKKRAKVTRKLEKGKTGTDLVLSPAAAFLDDPAVSYPVVVDPDIYSVTHSGDAYVSSGEPTLAHNTYRLLNGTFDGSWKYRSYLEFYKPTLPAGAYVVSSRLHLYQYTSTTCTPTPISAHPVTTAFTANVTWSNQPAVNLHPDYAGSASFSHGLNGSPCANAFDSIDITNMAKGWLRSVDPLPSEGIALRSSETDTSGAKSFCSMNQEMAAAGSTCSYADRNPRLSVTYNTLPSAPSGRSVTPCTTDCIATGDLTAIATGTTPTLTGQASDPDGGQLQYDYEVWDDDDLLTYPDTACGGTTTDAARVAAVRTGSIASGTLSSWAVPSGRLLDGHYYAYRVRAWDGTDCGAWSTGWVRFRVDVSAPEAPAIHAEAYPRSLTSPATAALFEWSSPSQDVVSFRYGLDTPAPTLVTDQMGLTLSPSPGHHTLYVEATDAAGYRSPVAAYPFVVGTPAGPPTTPAAPTVSPVSNGVVTTGAPTLTATSTDPSGGNVAVEFSLAEIDVATGLPDEEPLLYTVTVPSGSTARWTPADAREQLQFGVRYELRARAYNGAASSAVSPATVFTVLPASNTAPTITSMTVAPLPPNASGSTVTSLTPTLRVDASDAEQALVRVFVRVYSGVQVIWSDWAPHEPGVMAAGHVTVPDGVLTHGQSYNWQARVYDGQLDAWSALTPFTVNSMPAPPEPAADLVPVSVATSTGAGTYEFAGSGTDPNGGDVQLLFEVRRPDGSIAASGASDPFDAGTYGTWEAPAGTLINGTEYTWAARTSDGTNVSAWSAGPAFIADTTIVAEPEQPESLTVQSNHEKRSNNFTKHILMVHGYSRTADSDCKSTWDKLSQYLRRWYIWERMLWLSYYSNDKNCDHDISGWGSHAEADGGSGEHADGVKHGHDTNIKHLAFHWAWYVNQIFSSRRVRVDVVTHSMGGLIVRWGIYGQQQRRANKEDYRKWPSVLYVEDVINMGTPHGGHSDKWIQELCETYTDQCRQMDPDDPFITVDLPKARNPQAYGTDWTVMGSKCDQFVFAWSATSSKLAAPHRIRYMDKPPPPPTVPGWCYGIRHSDYQKRTDEQPLWPAKVWLPASGKYSATKNWRQPGYETKRALYYGGY